MSLIHTIITNHYAIMGAESRVVTENGTVYDGINKILKINANLIIGLSGCVEDNLLLFSDYCDYVDGEGFVLEGSWPKLTYQELVENITPKFLEMFAVKKWAYECVPYDVKSIVCGFTGNGYDATFFHSDKGVLKGKRLEPYPFTLVTVGKMQHGNYLNGRLQAVYIWNGEIILEDYLMHMKNTFINGSKIDEEINNDFRIEIIEIVTVARRDGEGMETEKQSGPTDNGL